MCTSQAHYAPQLRVATSTVLWRLQRWRDIHVCDSDTGPQPPRTVGGLLTGTLAFLELGRLEQQNDKLQNALNRDTENQRDPRASDAYDKPLILRRPNFGTPDASNPAPPARPHVLMATDGTADQLWTLPEFVR